MLFSRLAQTWVLSGTCTPVIVSPLSGGFIPPRITTGGRILSPSLMTDCRYGKSRASEALKGLDMEPLSIAVLLSAFSFEYALGAVIMYSRVEHMAVAVVSDPAIYIFEAKIVNYLPNIMFSGRTKTHSRLFIAHNHIFSSRPRVCE